MSEACKVVAAVMVEGLATFGKSDMTAVYVCTMTGVYAAPAAPIVCSSAVIATTVGKWATTPAGKALINEAAIKGCNVVVRGGEILLVEGRRTAETFKKSAKEAEKTYRALDTAQGINWLMRYLSGGI